MHTVELYRRVRLACHVDGLSQREAARRFGISRDTVKKMLAHSVPPGYRRGQPLYSAPVAEFCSAIDNLYICAPLPTLLASPTELRGAPSATSPK